MRNILDKIKLCVMFLCNIMPGNPLYLLCRRGSIVELVLKFGLYG